MAAYVIERYGHKQTYYGDTAGQAKYQAYLDSESGLDFGEFLKTIDSCRKDKYYRPMQEEKEKPNIHIGDKVVMHTCYEAEVYDGKLWTVTTEPRMMCGTWVVWLEGFSGCFDCQYLQVVKEDE